MTDRKMLVTALAATLELKVEDAERLADELLELWKQPDAVQYEDLRERLHSLAEHSVSRLKTVKPKDEE